MRVALGLHKDNIKAAIETYELISHKYFIHATPTLFHAGTCNPAMLSCFLLGMHDSVEGIYKCLGDCAQISKYAGGIGIWLTDIRANNSQINCNLGKSSGIVPMCRVFNDCARHINQSGKRLGSFAFYIEPWHDDIFDFLNLKKNHGDEAARARDLFYAVYIPDLFMKKVQANDTWHLFCPNESPGLTDCYGDEFEALYDKYVQTGQFRREVKARELWKEIISSQIETGTPYIVYKDAANSKSNQKNLGVIKSSNLCTEILEYSAPDEYACCTLGSISLSAFVEPVDYCSKKFRIYTKPDCVYCQQTKILLEQQHCLFVTTDFSQDEEGVRAELQQLLQTYKPQTNKSISCSEESCSIDDTQTITFPQIFELDSNDQIISHIGGHDELSLYLCPHFNYEKLIQVTRVLTNNLDKVVDINFYPVPETERSNKRHRPLGIGVQGLADVFAKFRVGFDHPLAKELNQKIFATLYYGALLQSIDLAKEKGPYSTFKGSPASQGQLQFDLWGVEPISVVSPEVTLDWDTVKEQILEHGLRNSLLLAPMPTASTSQILGNNECIEPFTSAIYSRRTLSGDFIVINKYLQQDLQDLGLWTEDMKNIILMNRGSIQGIKSIPKNIQARYKTSWDLSQKILIDLARDRGPYICQSQSLNLFIQQPNVNKLSSMHFYSWKAGLKTGIYYLRTMSVSKAQQFTIDPELQKRYLAELTPVDEHECCSA